MARRARFKVLGRFDGAPVATVEIEYHGAELSFFRVRPLRRHRVFELTLADVARGVIFDVTRKELADKRRAKQRR
jgi:hypothetical protein